MPDQGTKTMLPQTDHDLLIKVATLQDRSATDVRDLHTAIGGVQSAVQEIGMGLDKKIAEAVASKIDAKEVYQMKDDAGKEHTSLDKRISFIERYMWIAIGGVYVLYFLFQSGLLKYPG